MEQSHTVRIDAPPERVWAILADIARWPEWTDTVTKIERLDDGPLAVGSRATITQPKLPETEYVVTELDAGRSFTWVAKGPGVRTTARHSVTAESDGGTTLRLSVAQEGPIGSIAGRFYRKMTDRYLATEAAGLKARAEANRRSERQES